MRVPEFRSSEVRSFPHLCGINWHYILLICCISFLTSCSRDTEAKRIWDIPYGADSRQRVDVYLPEGYGPETPLVIMFHGGGWKIGDRKDNHKIAEALLKKGIASVSVGYRLVDSAKGIAAPQISADIRAGVAKVMTMRKNWGIAQGRVGMFGISAGGHLSLLYSYAYDVTHQIDEVVAYAGPSDLEAEKLLAHPHMKLMVDHYLASRLGSGHLDAKLWSPIDFVGSQTPKTLLIHGRRDTTVDVSQSIAMDSILRARGLDSRVVVLDTLGHSLDQNSLAVVVKLLAGEFSQL